MQNLNTFFIVKNSGNSSQSFLTMGQQQQQQTSPYPLKIRKKFKKLYKNKIYKNIYKYGGMKKKRKTIISPCIRMKKSKIFLNEITKHPSTIRPYQIIYLIHTGHISNKNNNTEISHICGNKLCIEPTHMCIENKKKNLQRKTCHSKIKKYVKKYRNNKNIKTCATLFMSDIINNKYQCPHKPNACFINYGKINK